MTQPIPIDQIKPNPCQPRKHFSHEDLQSLAQSIKENGVIQPVVVERNGDGYILHDGERRVRAAKLAGLYAVPAHIADETEAEQRLIRALVANVQRADLNAIEEAEAYQELREQGQSVWRIAQMMGVSHDRVKTRLALLELDKPIQRLVAAGQLPRDRRFTKALMSIPDTEARLKLAQRLARPGITINAAVNACERLKARMEEEQQAQTDAAPAVALMPKRAKPEATEKWRNVRAAAQAMCDCCDANPNLESVPEPAWSLILESARTTCDQCNLRAQNNLSICRECPSVELLSRLVGKGGEQQ